VAGIAMGGRGWVGWDLQGVVEEREGL